LYQVFVRKDFSHQFIAWLHELSNGNPAQLRRCVELAIEEGFIFKKEDIWFHQDNYDSDVILQRLSGTDQLLAAMQAVEALEPDLMTCINYAALMHGSIDYRVIASLQDKSKIRILKDFCLLTDKKIFDQKEDDSYQFKHSALPSMLMEQIPAEKQAEMHAELATTILTLDSFDVAEKVYLLAYHYSKTDLQDCKIRSEKINL